MGDDGEELASARVVPELSADAGPDPVGSPVAKQDRPGRHRAANAWREPSSDASSSAAATTAQAARPGCGPCWANLLRDAFRKFARAGCRRTLAAIGP